MFIEKRRWFNKIELNKSEYQILSYFYEVNQSLTKHELLEKIPDLNKNTAAVVIKRLLDKGYIEVGEIKYSNTVLARDYRTSIPFKDFLKVEYGEFAVEKLVKHAISSLEDKEKMTYLSNLITKRKNSINKID